MAAPISPNTENRWARGQIARTTLDAIERGTYDAGDITYDIREAMDAAKRDTVYLPPDSVLSTWASTPAPECTSEPVTEVSFRQISTLQGARALAAMLPRPETIGVLNFASAKNPGGGFLGGSQAQEESLARSSTLYPTLMTDTAQRFYHNHKRDPEKGYYSHSVVYSPGVRILREDSGAWVPPLAVDILTCPAVNAGVVRRHLREAKSDDESGIAMAMHERMARILFQFERRGVKNLVLGSFGTGVFKNRVEVVARIWAELLAPEEGRFASSFEKVVFAIKDEKTFDSFKVAYTATGPRAHERADTLQNKPGPSRTKQYTGVVAIAHSTLEAVERGSYTVGDASYDIRDAVGHSKSHTTYFAPDPESTLSCWETPPQGHHRTLPATDISFHALTTVEGARLMSAMLPKDPAERAAQLIGVLNFASAKNPGGGFLGGARAQEESIARSSSLYASLTTPTARAFYDLHKGSLRKGYYSHAMIYSPRVLLFRDDEGGWEPPLEVEVLTSPAVNAGALRRKSPPTEELEAQIADTMRSRMGRILYLFEKQGVRNLVLGSYGTGAFRNKIEVVAGIWAELLVHEGARFRDSFDRIVFAVVDRKEWGTNTLEVFKETFER